MAYPPLNSLHDFCTLSCSESFFGLCLSLRTHALTTSPFSIPSNRNRDSRNIPKSASPKARKQSAPRSTPLIAPSTVDTCQARPDYRHPGPSGAADRERFETRRNDTTPDGQVPRTRASVKNSDRPDLLPRPHSMQDDHEDSSPQMGSRNFGTARPHSRNESLGHRDNFSGHDHTTPTKRIVCRYRCRSLSYEPYLSSGATTYTRPYKSPGRKPAFTLDTFFLIMVITFLHINYTECCSRRAPLKTHAPLDFNVTEALRNANYRVPTPPFLSPASRDNGDNSAEYPDTDDRSTPAPRSHPHPSNVSLHNLTRACNVSTESVICGPNAVCVKGTCQCKIYSGGFRCDYSYSSKEVSVNKASVTSGIIVAVLFAFTIIFILYLFLQRKKRSLYIKSALAIREIAATKNPYELNIYESNLSQNPYEINPEQVTMGSTPGLFQAKFYDLSPEYDNLAALSHMHQEGPFRHLQPFRATFEELLNSIALVSYKSGHIFRNHISLPLRGRHVPKTAGERDRGPLKLRVADEAIFPPLDQEDPYTNSPFQRESSFLSEPARLKPIYY